MKASLKGRRRQPTTEEADRLPSMPPIQDVGILDSDGLPAPIVLSHNARTDALARCDGVAIVIDVAGYPEARMDHRKVGPKKANLMFQRLARGVLERSIVKSLDKVPEGGSAFHPGSVDSNELGILDQ
jgi:hypothetical protein